MKTAIAFDIYGTLIDTAGVVAELREIVGDRAEAFSALWREKQLEYSFRRALMHRYQVFSECVSQSLDYTAARLAVDLGAGERARLLDAFTVLPAFDDVAGCLAAIDRDEHDIYALSNGAAAAVEKLLLTAGIRDDFRAIVSVDEVGTFKPDPAVYLQFIRRAGVPMERAWLISGNPFDVIGAVSAGIQAVWLKRSADALFDPGEFSPTVTVTGLAAVPDAIRQWYADR